MKHSKTWTKEIFIDKSKKLFGDKYNYDKLEYKSTLVKVTLLCNTCGLEFGIRPYNHLYSPIGGCRTCSYRTLPQNQPHSQETFLKKARAKHGDKFEYLSRYINYDTPIKTKCKKCGLIWMQYPTNHLSGGGCRECRYEKVGKKRKTHEEFVAQCEAIHGDRFAYLSKYESSNKKIIIFCNECKTTFLVKPNNHLKGCGGCPKCKSSLGERKVQLFLEKHNIQFEKEKSFKDCIYKKPLRFDFYLPKYNICIEYDGYYHFHTTEWNNGDLNEVKIRDKIKNNYCKKNKIKLIRIKYTFYKTLEEILHKKIIQSKRKDLM